MRGSVESEKRRSWVGTWTERRMKEGEEGGEGEEEGGE